MKKNLLVDGLECIVYIVGILIVTSIFLSSCKDDDPCYMGEERCVGDKLQVCLDDDEWHQVEDCSLSGDDWECCLFRDRPYCLPSDKCEEHYSNTTIDGGE